MIGVREMRAADVEAVSAVRVRGWQAAYAGLVPAEYLDAMSVAENAAERRAAFARGTGRVLNLVATAAGGDGVDRDVVDRDVVGGEVVGWAALGPSREADAGRGQGELLALYARPDLIGTGVGRVLMAEVLARAELRGFGEIVLWVIEGNARARAFYAAAAVPQ